MRALTPALALALAPLIALALAGCSTPLSAEVPLAADLLVSIPQGAFDETSGGPWYSWDGPAQAPATIRFVNNDAAWHRILILPAPPQVAPDWTVAQDAQDHGGGHDHGGGADADEHDHAAMLAEHGTVPLADFELDAGEELVLTLEAPGLFTIHCHPHPWMEAVLQVDGANRSFSIEPQEVTSSRRADGTTVAGDSTVTPIGVDWPNLVSIQATVRWDDAGDDQAVGGESFNGPDTLRVQLIGPDGETVASQEATARSGSIDIGFNATPLWPAQVKAPSLAHAVASLSREAPDDTTHTGTWRLVVEVVDAPGLDPTGAGLPGGIDDEGQAWDATMIIVNAWPLVAA